MHVLFVKTHFPVHLISVQVLYLLSIIATLSLLMCHVLRLSFLFDTSLLSIKI